MVEYLHKEEGTNQEKNMQERRKKYLLRSALKTSGKFSSEWVNY